MGNFSVLFTVLLMILAIVCSLFSDKIDRAVTGGEKGSKSNSYIQHGSIIDWFDCDYGKHVAGRFAL